MIIVFTPDAPFDCPVFDFESQARQSALAENATIAFLDGSPLKWPWQLRGLVRKAAPGEKVVVHSTSAQGVMAAAECRTLCPAADIDIVFSPPYSDDAKDVERLRRYAAKADMTLFTDPDMAAACASAWPIAETPLILPAPVVAPTVEVENSPTLLFQGAITPGSRLTEAIEFLRDNPEATLRVHGTGKGRWAMPAVKLSRRLGTEPRVVWAGNDFDNVIIGVVASTTLLVPEPRSGWQSVVAVSYAAQGAVVKPTPSAEASGNRVEGVPLETFFDTLLRYYRSL